MSPRRPIELLRAGTLPALLTENFRIVAANGMAEAMLARRSAELCGRACEDVVGGRDIFRNRFCHGRCTVRQMLAAGEFVREFRLRVDGAAEPFEAWVSPLVFPRTAGRALTVLHLLEPVPPGASTGSAVTAGSRDLTPARAAVFGLTPRESDVLSALVAGQDTPGLATLLDIEPSTARNHVQGVLSKLGAASRAEAVATARWFRLVAVRGDAAGVGTPGTASRE